MRISDWSSDVCSSDLKRTRLALPRTMIPTPSPVKSRPLFSKKAPKKPEPFRASQESRSSQDGRLFYVLVFRDHSPDRDSTGLSIPHAVRRSCKGGERRNGQRRPAWPGADESFVNESALAER